MTTTVPKKRIEYLDALRGFTMLLVVYHHVELFGFHLSPEYSINSVFIQFRMPLFFFVSGFLAYSAGKVWTGKVWISATQKKILIQVIPTLVFGLLYTYLVKQQNIQTFLAHSYKLGYWFTISLLEMFIIYYTCNYLAHKFSKTDSGGVK